MTFEYDNIKAAIGREVTAKLGLKTLFTRRYGKRFNLLFILGTFTTWYAYPLIPSLITAGITNSQTHLLINGILQIWNLFWSLLAADRKSVV